MAVIYDAGGEPIPVNSLNGNDIDVFAANPAGTTDKPPDVEVDVTDYASIPFVLPVAVDAIEGSYESTDWGKSIS